MTDEVGKHSLNPAHDFPQLTQLHQGVILCTIAQALFVAQGATDSTRSWDGMDYVLSNDQGTVGDVTFHATGVIAAFADFHSPRWTPRSQTEESWRKYFTGVPRELFAIGEEAKHAIGSMVAGSAGCITAGFWSEGNRLRGSEEWSAVYEHGAHILRLELLPIDQAAVALAEEYGFESREMRTVLTVFEQRLHSTGEIVISSKDQQALFRIKDRQNEIHVAELLMAIGIVIRDINV